MTKQNDPYKIIAWSKQKNKLIEKTQIGTSLILLECRELANHILLSHPKTDKQALNFNDTNKIACSHCLKCSKNFF